MASASSATVGAVLPVFLLGGQSVLVASELGFDASGLGLAVSAFFTVSAAGSVPTGRLVERFGPTVTTRAGILLAAVSLLGIAAFARSYAVLVVFLVLGGLGNGLAQLGSNLSLARYVPQHRQGLAFGVKQAAVPAATLLAGVAVPAIGLTIGWRWSFALAGTLVLLALLLVPVNGAPARRSTSDRGRANAALGVIAVAAALGAGTANGLGTFLVSSAVDRGIDPALAGLTLSLGGAVGVVVRLVGGWLADRRDGGHLLVVAGMFAGGTVGLALLAVPSAWALVAGTVLGFGLGWSWPGVLTFAVVRLNPTAPAAATGITQAGVYAGGAFGPLTFGAVVEASSYQVAWLAAAGTMVLGGVLMLVGRGMLVRRRLARTVRPAVDADVPAVKHVVDAAFEHYIERIGIRPAPMDNDHAANVRAGEVFVVAAPPVAAVVLVPMDDHLYLDTVAVHPSRQGEGLGRVLLEYAEQYARELDLPEIRLCTNAMMWENQKLYPRLGYERVDRRIDEGRDRIFYRKAV